MAGGTVIRELGRGDAAAVARLQLAINPHQIVTPEHVWHRATRGIARERRREWVAEVDGEVVACAQAGFEWSVPTPGKGRFWIGVLPEHRGHRIGGELYAVVDGYLRDERAWRLRSWVDGDPAGERFLRRRGYERSGADRVSALDLRTVDFSSVPRSGPEGVRVVPLREVRDRAQELFEICAAGERDMPGDEPETELSLEDWRREEFDHPLLSKEGSFVALADDRPVSLAFLTVDPERRLAYNQMTATLPQYRRRGLAFLVKLAAARWSASTGIERLLTENDVENAGMLAINNRLGYQPLYDQTFWVLERERPPGERG
jgi:GNAT superfamily N-acetyltransferase